MAGKKPNTQEVHLELEKGTLTKEDIVKALGSTASRFKCQDVKKADEKEKEAEGA